MQKHVILGEPFKPLSSLDSASPQQGTQRSSCALRVQSSDKVSPHRHTRFVFFNYSVNLFLLLLYMYYFLSYALSLTLCLLTEKTYIKKVKDMSNLHEKKKEKKKETKTPSQLRQVAILSM